MFPIENVAYNTYSSYKKATQKNLDILQFMADKD